MGQMTLSCCDMILIMGLLLLGVFPALSLQSIVMSYLSSFTKKEYGRGNVLFSCQSGSNEVW